MRLYQINYPTPTPWPTPNITPVFELEPEMLSEPVIGMFQGGVTGCQLAKDHGGQVVPIIEMTILVVFVLAAIASLWREIKNL